MNKLAHYYRRYGYYLYLTLLASYALFSILASVARLEKEWAAVVLFVGGLMIPGVLTVKFCQALETSFLLRALDKKKEKDN